MTTAQKIRMVLALRRMSEAELARLIGSTPSAFNQRMKTDKFSSIEMEHIAAALNCTYKIEFILNDTGEKV